jgi:hypothetical protein
MSRLRARLANIVDKHHATLGEDACEAIHDAIAALADEAASQPREGAEARLRADLKHADDAVIARCEGCQAPLFDGDNMCSDPNGVYGCWHTMTDVPDTRNRPCYAYRVGKPSAALHDTAPTDQA